MVEPITHSWPAEVAQQIMAAALSPMAKMIRSLGYKHDMYRVFADFCEVAACSLSNAVDRQNYDRREAQYMNIVKKYSRDEVQLFSTLLGMLVMELEQEPRDVLGELFSELELHNEHAGQFFTPNALCELIAAINFDKTEVANTISERGYITLQEPAVGAGAMVIAVTKHLLAQQINYQRCLHVSAIDIDSRCVHMAYVQFSLLHLPAVVYAGDTLTMEMRDAWYTPAHILGGWTMRLNSTNKEEVLPKPPIVVATIAEQQVLDPPIAIVPAPSTEKPKRSTGKPESNQLTLF